MRIWMPQTHHCWMKKHCTFRGLCPQGVVDTDTWAWVAVLLLTQSTSRFQAVKCMVGCFPSFLLIRSLVNCLNLIIRFPGSSRKSRLELCSWLSPVQSRECSALFIFAPKVKSSACFCFELWCCWVTSLGPVLTFYHFKCIGASFNYEDWCRSWALSSLSSARW